MKLIYITTKKYPGTTADHHYIGNLAKAFHAILGEDFYFVVCNTDPSTLPGIPLVQVSIPDFIKRTLFFFFWIPWFWLTFSRKNGEKVVFFSNDQNLLSLLIFWKKTLCLSFKVTADWHMFSQTWKDGFIARYADYSITTSHKLEHAVRKLSPYSHAYTVYGGVDTTPYEEVKDKMGYDKTRLREELNLPKNKFLAGYVGLFLTMGMEKGISTMIDALSELDQDVTMVFVGGRFHEIKKYEAQAASKNVLEKCIFLPVQPFDKVVKYEKAMDALVIPYPDEPHFRSYGFPMKIYEYMASVVPIIYTKLELLEEVIADCAYGILPDSPHDLAQAISTIRLQPQAASAVAMKALHKIYTWTWAEKAQNIIKIFDILPIMLIIPNNALKYILFQRTEFSVYTSHPWLLRIVMNRRLPIYNHAVNLEATLFKKRTKRFFSADMEREYDLIKNHLPDNPQNILDIGCGVAGIDIMLYRHYSQSGIGSNPYLHLFDKTEINKKVYYGLEKEAAYYNSLGIAREILIVNGVEPSHISTQEVTDKPIFPGKRFDLVISLISWGFHYPINMYIEEVFNSLKIGGMLIVDARKGTDGESMLEKKFGSLTIISETTKYRRIAVTKK